MGLEEVCIYELYRMCEDVSLRQRPELVRLKNGRTAKIPAFHSFFWGSDCTPRWDRTPFKKYRLGTRRPRCLGDARYWIEDNSGKILSEYFRSKYHGDILQAMRVCGSLNAMRDDFCEYFAERRDSFLVGTGLVDIGQYKELSKKGKVPLAHGGVASLLKVLTKTMMEKGLGINDIAKMQYAICVQAGVYVIPEFLTDVLVADQLINENDTTK